MYPPSKDVEAGDNLKLPFLQKCPKWKHLSMK